MRICVLKTILFQATEEEYIANNFTILHHHLSLSFINTFNTFQYI